MYVCVCVYLYIHVYYNCNSTVAEWGHSGRIPFNTTPQTVSPRNPKNPKLVGLVDVIGRRQAIQLSGRLSGFLYSFFLLKLAFLGVPLKCALRVPLTLALRLSFEAPCLWRNVLESFGRRFLACSPYCLGQLGQLVKPKNPFFDKIRVRGYSTVQGLGLGRHSTFQKTPGMVSVHATGPETGLCSD